MFGTIFGLATSIGSGIAPIAMLLLVMARGMAKTPSEDFPVLDVEDERELEYPNR